MLRFRSLQNVKAISNFVVKFFVGSFVCFWEPSVGHVSVILNHDVRSALIVGTGTIMERTR